VNAIRPYLKAVLPALTGLGSSLLTFLASNDDTVPALDLEPPAKLKVDKQEPHEA
jgi:hypothetical protein